LLCCGVDLLSAIDNETIKIETKARQDKINVINSYLFQMINAIGVRFGSNSNIIYLGSMVNQLCIPDSDIDIKINLEISSESNLTQNDFLGDVEIANQELKIITGFEVQTFITPNIDTAKYLKFLRSRTPTFVYKL
jgi:DNA polymerase sigma